MPSELVLVTGASGFIAKHVVTALIGAGFDVRGTLRDPAKADAVRAAVARLSGDDPGDRLSFVTADLLADAGWEAAMAGVAALVHTAMVVLDAEPARRETVVGPGVAGTRRVFEAAGRAGVRRAVMTGSVAAVGYGHRRTGPEVHHGPEDWTDLTGPDLWAYAEAKTRGERAAWEIAEARGMALTTILAGMVLGPVADADISVSLRAVWGLLDGSTPALPDMGYTVIDVRDLAELHVRAVQGAAPGQRVIAAAEYLPFARIAKILAAAYPGYPVPRRSIPAWALRPLALFMPSVRMIRADIGVTRRFDGASGHAMLGRPYRSAEEAVLTAAESLIEAGVLKRR